MVWGEARYSAGVTAFSFAFAIAMFHFSQLNPLQVESSLDQLLAENQEKLQVILEKAQPYTWENLIVPLEEMDEALNTLWAPVQHLHAVVSSETWRTLYNR